MMNTLYKLDNVKITINTTTSAVGLLTITPSSLLLATDRSTLNDRTTCNSYEYKWQSISIHAILREDVNQPKILLQLDDSTEIYLTPPTDVCNEIFAAMCKAAELNPEDIDAGTSAINTAKLAAYDALLSIPNSKEEQQEQGQEEEEKVHAVQIIHTETSHGRITIATSNYKKGAVVFKEKPLVAIQSIFNKSQALVCNACHRFVGDISLQAGLLTQQISRLDIINSTHNDSSKKSTFNSNILGSNSNYKSCSCILCPDGCGEVYCSTECVTEHQRRGHALLCTGPHTNAHPVVAFKTHAVSTNEIFLFAADVAVDVVERYKKMNYNIVKAWQPYSEFVQEPWWELVHSPKDAESPEIFANQLKTIATESLDLFIKALTLLLKNEMKNESNQGSDQNGKKEQKDQNNKFNDLFDFLNVDRWGRIVGMFEQNQLGIRVASPIGTAVQNMANQGKAIARENVESVLDLADDIDEADPGEDGEGECEDEDCEEDEMEGENGEAENGDGIEIGKRKETNNPMKVDEDAMFQCGPCDVPENEIGGIGGGFIGLIQGETKGNEEDEAYARLELVAEMSNEYFPPLDGTALFSIGCSMNHSCRPNVSPVWNPKSDVPIEIHFLALSDIKKGDEINFSYIDMNVKDVEERRKMLIDYGFICECVRCKEESSGS